MLPPDTVSARCPARPPGRRLARAASILVWLSLPLVLAPGAAFAQASEQIQFDFTSGSSISLLGGTIVTPPDGTLDVGHARVDVEVTAPGVYVPGGQLVLAGLTVSGTISKIIAGFADISGYYSATQPTPLVGTLAPALDGGQFVDPLGLQMNTAVGCTGTGCAALGFPINDVGLSLLNVSFLPITDLDVVGGARIETSIPIEIDGVLGTLDLVGVEVARTYVPEPGTFVLVAAGMLWMAVRRR